METTQEIVKVSLEQGGFLPSSLHWQSPLWLPLCYKPSVKSTIVQERMWENSRNGPKIHTFKQENADRRPGRKWADSVSRRSDISTAKNMENMTTSPPHKAHRCSCTCTCTSAAPEIQIPWGRLWMFPTSGKEALNTLLSLLRSRMSSWRMNSMRKQLSAWYCIQTSKWPL